MCHRRGGPAPTAGHAKPTRGVPGPSSLGGWSTGSGSASRSGCTRRLRQSPCGGGRPTRVDFAGSPRAEPFPRPGRLPAAGYFETLSRGIRRRRSCRRTLSRAAGAALTKHRGIVGHRGTQRGPPGHAAVPREPRRVPPQDHRRAAGGRRCWRCTSPPGCSTTSTSRSPRATATPASGSRRSCARTTRRRDRRDHPGDDRERRGVALAAVDVGAQTGRRHLLVCRTRCDPTASTDDSAHRAGVHRADGRTRGTWMLAGTRVA